MHVQHKKDVNFPQMFKRFLSQYGYFWFRLFLAASHSHKKLVFSFFSRPLKGTVSQEFLIIFLRAFSQRYSKVKFFLKNRVSI